MSIINRVRVKDGWIFCTLGFCMSYKKPTPPLPHTQNFINVTAYLLTMELSVYNIS